VLNMRISLNLSALLLDMSLNEKGASQNYS
jgi:hypothetical protein